MHFIIYQLKATADFTAVKQQSRDPVQSVPVRKSNFCHFWQDDYSQVLVQVQATWHIPNNGSLTPPNWVGLTGCCQGYVLYQEPTTQTNW